MSLESKVDAFEMNQDKVDDLLLLIVGLGIVIRPQVLERCKCRVCC